MRDESVKEFVCRMRDLVHSTIESLLVCLGRAREAA
jgi:hypothetical protein